jgi:hypothetical protein
MSDLPIRPVTVAEHARIAAQLAHDTMTEQPNPYAPGTVEAVQWNAAYCRWNLAYSACEGTESSA